jgi:hypothetical protein
MPIQIRIRIYMMMPIQIRIRIRIWHQIDADPRADPIPNFILVGKSDFFYFSSKHCQFTIFFYLSHTSQMCHNFQYFGKHV